MIRRRSRAIVTAMNDTCARGAVAWGETSTRGGGFVIPAGTVTLLLADVEGSTRLWEGDSGTMAPALAKLHAAVDTAVAAHDGVRPVEQGEGDSVVAAFSKASDALAAAVAIQRSLATGPLRLRIGVHTGEVELRGNDNYVGPTVNRTARLRDIGHGGQILVSRAAADVARSVPSGCELVDLGSHRLRDLGAPMHVLQLVHTDLRREFPPLRSLDEHPHNLPVALTSFIGRDCELAEVGDLLTSSRLLTLTGSGGSGKTRLALEVAASAVDRYPDGVWFCDFSSLAGDEPPASTVATAMGATPTPGERPIDVLHRHLKRATVLLVFDNCEHVVEQTASLAEKLLRACPHLSILATSREQLGVAGEVAWRVPSLPTPERGDAASLEVLSQSDAVRLFVDRAVSARPGFVVTSANAPAIAEICAQLDGLPLAIELAAARTRVLTAEEIAAGLSDRFRMLGRGSRTAMPRQQTLAASVAWSHDLLTEQQRIVFRRLSVFAGGFDLGAAEAVVPGADVAREDVLELVAQLVDRSLVQMEDSGGRARYRMLETVRQYAAVRLADAGEAVEVQDRHLARYAARSTDWPALLDRKPHALIEPHQEEANVRAALRWAAAAERADEGLVLAHGVTDIWCGRRGAGHELDAWLRRLLAVEGASPRAKARGWQALAAVAAWNWDHSAGFAAGVQALAAAREVGDELLEAECKQNLASARITIDYEAGVEELTRCASIFGAHGRDDLARRAQWLLAYWSVFAESSDLALTLLAELREAAAPSVDPAGLAMGLWKIPNGMARCFRGDMGQAEVELRGAVEVLEDAGSWWWRRVAGSCLAWVECFHGDVVAATARAEAEIEAVGARPPMPVLPAMFLLTVHDLDRGDHGAALKRASRLRTALPEVTWLGRSMTALGRIVEAVVAQASGDTAAAGAMASEAVETARRCHYPFIAGMVLAEAARIARRSGEPEASERLAREAIDALTSGGVRVLVPGVLEVLAGLDVDQGDHLDGARLLGAAAALRERMGTAVCPFDLGSPGADIDTAAGSIGREEFEKARSEGAALDYEEVLAYVNRGRGPRKRPSSGWASLTPAEQSVVKLVAEGLSNPEIAERLFISRKTVATHLSHVFAKLGVTSRAELAAAATRRETSVS